MKDEVFLNIEGYDGYCVSNMGRVKSLKHGKDRILKQSFNGGYLGGCITKKGVSTRFHTNVLMAIAFLSHKPNGNKLVVDHIDNNPSNNNINNLQVITQRENTSKDTKGSSKYTGVSFCNSRKKYCAGIQINGRVINLGRFDKEEDARDAYNEKLTSYVKSCKSK